MAMMALKVKIGLTPSGSAQYPDFGSLDCVKKTGQDWSYYVDKEGHGWAYDRCGHKDHADDSPVGMQWGLLIVPEEFALEAEQKFPDLCDALTEAEAEAFWEQRCHSHLPDDTRDTEALTAMKAEIQLLQTLIAAETDAEEKAKLETRLKDVLISAKAALDPCCEVPGVRHNERKKWCEFKKKVGLDFKGKQR